MSRSRRDRHGTEKGQAGDEVSGPVNVTAESNERAAGPGAQEKQRRSQRQAESFTFKLPVGLRPGDRLRIQLGQGGA
eukprot:7104161-Prymnesium_polylepis.1